MPTARVSVTIFLLLNNIILERGLKVLTASWRGLPTMPCQSMRPTMSRHLAGRAFRPRSKRIKSVKSKCQRIAKHSLP